MFTHTLCAFEPKFAHTLCANKHFHVPKLFFCLQPSYPNFYHIWSWFVPPLTGSGSGCLGRGSLGGNAAQIRTHPQNLQRRRTSTKLDKKKKIHKTCQEDKDSQNLQDRLFSPTNLPGAFSRYTQIAFYVNIYISFKSFCKYQYLRTRQYQYF